MRALLVCAAPVEGSDELVAVLASEADLVVAVDGGGALCTAAGIVPDVVVGDFDSLAASALARLREHGTEAVEFPAEKDASDLELAVAEARRRGATSIVVTGASSGRLDHTLAGLGVVAAARDLAPRVVEPDIEVWVLSPEGRASLRLRGEGATISVLAFSAETVVSVEGVVWELDSATLTPESSLGLSNRIGSAGLARIVVSEGVALALAPRTPGTAGAQEA